MSKNIKKSFSIESKYNILLDFRRNKLTQTEICRKYDISFSTFHRWVKTESEIKEKFESNAFIPDRKRDRASKYEQVEKELYKWFVDARQKNLPISGPVLLVKAAEIAEKLNTEFIPNNGWLNRFKKRHNISYKRLLVNQSLLIKALWVIGVTLFW